MKPEAFEPRKAIALDSGCSSACQAPPKLERWRVRWRQRRRQMWPDLNNAPSQAAATHQGVRRLHERGGGGQRREHAHLFCLTRAADFGGLPPLTLGWRLGALFASGATQRLERACGSSAVVSSAGLVAPAGHQRGAGLDAANGALHHGCQNRSWRCHTCCKRFALAWPLRPAIDRMALGGAPGNLFKSSTYGAA
jgi:hypothetical protein